MLLKAYLKKNVFHFSDEEKYAYFGETVILREINFDDDKLTKENLHWFFGKSKLNATNYDYLNITFNDTKLFGSYYLQNKINGALVEYKIKCYDVICPIGRKVFIIYLLHVKKKNKHFKLSM